MEMGIQTVEKIACDDLTGCRSLVEAVTRREAVAIAKSEGWTFVDRGKKAYCAPHAPEVTVPRAALIALIDGVDPHDLHQVARESLTELATRVGRLWKVDPEEDSGE